MKTSNRGVILAAVPNLFMLVLFYSLVIHMHRSLGGWPTSIGERGFPGLLVLHVNVTSCFFIALLLFTLFVLPILTFGSVMVAHLRPYIRYFAWFVLFLGICLGLMQLAPEPFLYWWRD
jgi:hypothetical protein